MQNWKNLIAQTSGAAGRRSKTTSSGCGSVRVLLRLPPKRSLASTGGGGGGGSGAPFNQLRPSGECLSTRNQSTTRPNLAAKELLAPASSCTKLDDDELEDGLEPGGATTIANREASLRTHSFLSRHIGPDDQQQVDMLNEIGYASLEELVRATVPAEITLKRALRLPEACTESELLEELLKLANENEAHKWRSFIGQGFYDCVTPPVIMRNMFENPAWTTAYTAYQAEIAQGRLESLMNYQTLVTDLTGMDVANASLLDEASAAAEALQVCSRFAKSKRNKWLVSRNCHPQTVAVVSARAAGLGIQVELFDELSVDEPLESLKLNECSGVLIQYPNTGGQLHDFDPLIELCRQSGCLTVIATDLLACTLFKPPGDFKNRPDLAVGSSQRLGIPMNFGGPHAAFLACKKELVRYIPGRIVGLTRDSMGNQAYRFALQTREQHIRRDKATSNICTAQALLANMSAMYAVYHGPKGLREIAGSIHAKTSLLAQLLLLPNSSQQQQTNYQLLNGDNFFDTLSLRVADQASLKALAHQNMINLRYTGRDLVSISLDETTKLSEVFQLARLVRSCGVAHQAHNEDDRKLSSQIAREKVTPTKDGRSIVRTPLQGNLAHLARTSPFLTHPTFNSHRSEAQIVRYMKQLESKDISLAHSMIPLGSCTMKLNATSEMIASSWPEFTRCHPFQPVEQCRGYMELIQQLNEYLCEITGYASISFQPNSGAQGEYAGLRVIRAYLESIGQQHRDLCLIPVSAHGTNPASAQMAGLRVQTIKVRENGNIDLEHLQSTIEAAGDKLACLMVTYPSTFGVFEASIRKMCDMVHAAGGQVYLDGANMNAQVGLCRPADYGSDVSHLNLHKTFCIPHGGGGPGVGPIGVREHLVPFLPENPLAKSMGQKSSASFGSVASSMWGSAAILPISWSYIRLMGAELKKSSQIAILSANYMKKRLEGAYDILYRGEQGNVAHEFIIDCRKFKKTGNVEAVDIAKRLQDFGLHAPTVSWPISNTLMLEPTESEDKQQLDRYCDALLVIRKEIAAIESGQLDRQNNTLKNAPHTQQVVCSSNWNRPYTREQAAFPASFVTPINKIWPTVGRVDDAYGDTNLFCTCPPASADFG